ncbi:MAG: putative lipopolysaccharide heptosyltransferase III [Thermodesulfobacteriota bacterium]
MTGGFKNVLIIKLKNLGDVLTTTPMLAAVTKAWPAAEVSYLVNRGAEDLVQYHPRVKEVFVFPRQAGLIGRIGLIREIWRRRFDLVLELSGGDRGAFLAWISGAAVRVGYRPSRRKRLDRRFFFTHRVDAAVDAKHTVEYHLDALRVLGLEPGFTPLELFWPPEAGVKVRRLLSSLGLGPDEPYAVVHPGSRWLFKTWTPAGNAEVVDYLARRHGLAVVLTSAAEAAERDLVRKIMSLVQTSPIDLSGRLTLPEMAALIAGARVFFGVDSLPMHMAAAVGTPAVALFGPSGEHMWRPWGPGHRVVAKDWDCRPCGRDGCGGSKICRCLMEVSAAEVKPALDRTLEKRR